MIMYQLLVNPHCMVRREHNVHEIKVLLEGRAEAATKLYLSFSTVSLSTGRTCTTVSVATAAWLLGQDAAEMAERTS